MFETTLESYKNILTQLEHTSQRLLCQLQEEKGCLAKWLIFLKICYPITESLSFAFVITKLWWLVYLVRPLWMRRAVPFCQSPSFQSQWPQPNTSKYLYLPLALFLITPLRSNYKTFKAEYSDYKRVTRCKHTFIFIYYEGNWLDRLSSRVHRLLQQ